MLPDLSAAPDPDSINVVYTEKMAIPRAIFFSLPLKANSRAALPDA